MRRKNRWMKKQMALLLAAGMLGSMLTGCGSSEDAAGESSKAADKQTTADTENAASETAADKEEVDLTMAYLVSGSFAGQDEVSQAIIDLAKEDLNVNLTVLPMTISEIQSQAELMITGGEDLDVFPFWASRIASFVDSGYVLDLNDYVDNMPNVLEWVGKDDVLACNLGGYVWGVPVMKERCVPRGIEMRKDILDELGYQIEDIKTLDDVTEVFAAVKKAYPDMTVLGGSSTEGLAHCGDMALICDPLNDELGVLDNYGAELTVVNEFETDFFRSIVDKTREWYEAGYVSKDMPTSTDTGETLMAAGNLFAFNTNYKPNTAAEKKSSTGYDLVTFAVTEPLSATTCTNSMGYCISGMTKNPERAAEFLDWLFGNQKVNDLMNYGIEDRDWVVDENGNANFPEGKDASTVSYHLDWGWSLPNQFVGHLWTGTDTDLYEQYQAFRENAHRSKAYGFSFDSRPVVDEVIACKAVLSEYLPGITTGSVDPETGLEEMNKALYEAGLQTVMDEKQKQLDEWAAKNGVQ